MEICQTERLVIRHFSESDAGFILQLLNSETFIEHIGDKNVRTHGEAVEYLKRGAIASYKQYGYGLNLVALKGSNTPIGSCGLVTREELPFPDLGYALLPEYCRHGYTHEACLAVLDNARIEHALRCLAAVTAIDNVASNRLLQKLGFTRQGLVKLYGKTNNYYEHHFEP